MALLSYNLFDKHRLRVGHPAPQLSPAFHSLRDSKEVDEKASSSGLCRIAKVAWSQMMLEMPQEIQEAFFQPSNIGPTKAPASPQ